MTSLHDHRFPGLTFADILAELDRAAAASDTVGAIAKGTMTRTDAARQAAIVDALRQDVARFAAAHAPLAAGRPLQRAEPATHAIPWADRRSFLLDELERRQRTYRAAIAKGNLAESVAHRQFDRLAALLAVYEGGHDFPQTEEYAEFFYEVLWKRSEGGLKHCHLHLDTAPTAESSPHTAPAPGRPMVDKGPRDDRSRQPARTLF